MYLHTCIKLGMNEKRHSPSIHGTVRLCRMENAGKMTFDKPNQMGFLSASIPAKPLAQAKLKCGGSLLPRLRRGGWREVHQTSIVVRAAGGPTPEPGFSDRTHPVK
jgi:hypothetical protein